MPFISCDNKEAHLFAHIKLNSLKRPCRFCNAEKQYLHSFKDGCASEQFILRSYEDLKRNMDNAQWRCDNSLQNDISKVSSKTKHNRSSSQQTSYGYTELHTEQLRSIWWQYRALLLRFATRYVTHSTCRDSKIFCVLGFVYH